MIETNTNKIKQHLRKYKSITRIEAFESYRIKRLNAIISELRKKGWLIEGEWEPYEDDEGTKGTCIRYRLISEKGYIEKNITSKDHSINVICWELEKGEIVLYSGKKIRYINLTPLEYKAFKIFKDEKLHAKEDLIDAVYDHKEITNKDAYNLKEIICRLNKKIRAIGHIYNEYLWGYKFKAKIGERENVEQ